MCCFALPQPSLMGKLHRKSGQQFLGCLNVCLTGTKLEPASGEAVQDCCGYRTCLMVQQGITPYALAGDRQDAYLRAPDQ